MVLNRRAEATLANVAVKAVNKEFHINGERIDVLKEINLEVKSGEFVCIVGASGCGKSTLLKMLAGLEKPTSGEIFIGSRKVQSPSVDCGMVFQEARLCPWLTVAGNIGFGIAKKVRRKERAGIVGDHIRLVGLEGFDQAFAGQLSGGMQQRVSIARALVNRPALLLLDEPLGALDALTRINMQKEILRIWEQEKTTMILVTHDIDEAVYLGDRVVVLSSRPGEIRQDIKVELGRPRDRTSDDFALIRRKVYREFFKDSSSQPEYFL